MMQTVKVKPKRTGWKPHRSLATTEDAQSSPWLKRHYLSGGSHQQGAEEELLSGPPCRAEARSTRGCLMSLPRPVCETQQILKMDRLGCVQEKPAPVGLLLSLWPLFFRPHLSLPPSVSVRQRSQLRLPQRRMQGKGGEYLEQEQLGRSQKWKRKSNSGLVRWGERSFLRNVNKSGNPGTQCSSDLGRRSGPFPRSALLFVNEIQIKLFIELCQPRSFQLSFSLWHGLNLKIIIIKKHMHVIKAPYSNGNLRLS